MMLAKYLRGFAGAIFLLNLFSIIFGIAYLVYPAYTPVWDLFGVILLITFFGDLLFVYLLDGILDKNVPSGNRINWAGYGFHHSYDFSDGGDARRQFFKLGYVF